MKVERCAAGAKHASGTVLYLDMMQPRLKEWISPPDHSLGTASSAGGITGLAGGITGSGNGTISNLLG